MKITSKKFTQKLITDPIQFQILDLSESPRLTKVVDKCVRFKVKFSDTEPFNEIEIGRLGTVEINQPGLSVNEWFKKMLNGKRLGTDSIKLEELGEDVMLVKNTSPAYILSTFFQILKRLEPKLKSLSYVD